MPYPLEVYFSCSQKWLWLPILCASPFFLWKQDFQASAVTPRDNDMCRTGTVEGRTIKLQANECQTSTFLFYRLLFDWHKYPTTQTKTVKKTKKHSISIIYLNVFKYRMHSKHWLYIKIYISYIPTLWFKQSMGISFGPQKLLSNNSDTFSIAPLKSICMFLPLNQKSWHLLVFSYLHYSVSLILFCKSCRLQPIKNELRSKTAKIPTLRKWGL